MKFLFSLFLALTVSLAAFASEINTDDDIPALRNEREPISITDIIDYNISNNRLNGFSPHKPNYFLLLSRSNYNVDRDKNEIKFQISVKQRMLRFYGWATYIGYTQKSLWQAYDGANSRPFRENNFNPEFFFRTKMWNGLRFDLGAEHESNGRSNSKSRSWNRIFLTPYFENRNFIVSLKGWYRIKEDAKKNESDTSGDDNPDIHKYMGYNELGITLKLPDFLNIYISAAGRFNFAAKRGAFISDITVPLFLSSASVMFQYFDGYGESLIDYNIKLRRIGIGVSCTR